jgi:hypothetical protein
VRGCAEAGFDGFIMERVRENLIDVAERSPAIITLFITRGG